MPANSPIPLPGNAIFEWRERYPEAADELVKAVNLMLSMRVELVTPNGYNSAQTAILASPNQYLLALPVRFRAPIADSSATAASASAQLNLLLAELRATKQLPA